MINSKRYPKAQIAQIYERRDHELYMDVDADKKDEQIIYIWRTTKLPLKVIAQKLDQTIDKVSEVIKYYKRMVRSQRGTTQRELQEQEERLATTILKRSKSFELEAHTDQYVLTV